jgi:hypothetical protein
MKPFKFFQKIIRKYNVYEEMVLGMLEYCRNNTINPVGMSHPFVMTELTGVNHKRIVITGVHKGGEILRPYIYINYNVHSEGYGDIMSVGACTLIISEDEYIRLTEPYERV